MDSRFGEHVWCRIGDLLVGIIFRSNNSRIVGHDYNTNLLQLLSSVSDKQVLILEDFNYPEIDWCTLLYHQLAMTVVNSLILYRIASTLSMFFLLLLQFSNFRYHGSRSWSETNFTYTAKFASPKNDLIGARIRNISSIEATSS